MRTNYSLNLALPALLSLAACGPRQPASVHIDPALLTLVPKDTVMLAGMKLDAARKTPLYEKLNTALHLDKPLEEIAEKTGFDPRADLWEVLIANNGKDSVVFARGKFSPHGIEPKFEKEGVRKTPYKGYALIGTDDFALTFMNATVAAAGKPASIRALIDARDQGTGPSSALLDRLSRIPPGNQFWAVTTAAQSFLPKDTKELPKIDGPLGGFMGNIPKIAAMLDSGDLAVDVSSGMKLEINVKCTNGENAKQLNTFVRGIVGVGRLQAKKELLPLFDGFETSVTEQVAGIKWKVPPELFESLLEQASAMRRGRPSTSSVQD